MNKQELIDHIAKSADISKAAAGRALDSAIGAIQTSMKKGGRVTLVGFGTSYVGKRAARSGRNPRTGATIAYTLKQKANALKSKITWAPSATDIQRGRVVMLNAYSQPSNLPLADFARLANKSRQQIYKDIAAKRLMALSVGKRGKRLPDWQLDPTKLALTQAVLAAADDVDEWTMFHSLCEPLWALRGRVPIEAVRPNNIVIVALSVLSQLGIRNG